MTATLQASALIDTLRQMLGADRVSDAAETRLFFGTDAFRTADPLPEAVVMPGDAQELAAAVGACTRAGFAVVPRGGGLSYTDGYLADRPGVVVVDTRRLAVIREINERDMYVTVECGVTWQKLYETLKAKGLRTPFYGTGSGVFATVGGALSQNAVNYGSARYGTSADSVLGLEVALADGSLLRTGSAATPFNPSPFFRHYGPDLTGIFLGDTGALGIKTAVTLKLTRFPPATRFAAFAFDRIEDLGEAMGEIGRQGLAMECFAADSRAILMRAKRMSLTNDVQILSNVAKGGRSWLSGLLRAGKVVAAGRRYLENAAFVLNVTVDGRDGQDADSALRQVQAIGRRFGRDTDASVPVIMRSAPFLPPTLLYNTDGDRWVPLHCIVPLSRFAAMFRQIEAFFARQEALLTAHAIEWNASIAAVGTNALLIEPNFYWKDAARPFFDHYFDRDYLARVKPRPENPQAAAAVQEMRRGLAQLFLEQGCTHLQIGRMYLYREGRDPQTWALLQAIKSYVDPRNLMNPGALALERRERP